MYPKSNSSPTSLESKKLAKREQLVTLLINKFRNKFRINLGTQQDLDEQIAREVIDLVMSDQMANDKQLAALDQKLTVMVEQQSQRSKPLTRMGSKTERGDLMSN